MPLAAGDKLGPYEILALIGAGGMGEVYKALDPRLNRGAKRRADYSSGHTASDSQSDASRLLGSRAV